MSVEINIGNDFIRSGKNLNCGKKKTDQDTDSHNYTTPCSDTLSIP